MSISVIIKSLFTFAVKCYLFTYCLKIGEMHSFTRQNMKTKGYAEYDCNFNIARVKTLNQRHFECISGEGWCFLSIVHHC